MQLSCKGVWRNARIVNDKIGNDLLETQQAKVRRRKIKKITNFKSRNFLNYSLAL